MLKIDQNSFHTLNTERLTLRQLSADDLDELFALRSNEQVNRYLGRPAATIESTIAFIEKINQITTEGQGFYWAITLKDDPKLIGTICYYNLNHEKDSAEIGYELLPDYHGKGLMDEAIKEVLRSGFTDIGLKLIIATPHPDNESSIKLLEKNGFEEDQTFEYMSEEEADGLAAYVLKKD